MRYQGFFGGGYIYTNDVESTPEGVLEEKIITLEQFPSDPIQREDIKERAHLLFHFLSDFADKVDILEEGEIAFENAQGYSIKYAYELDEKSGVYIVVVYADLCLYHIFATTAVYDETKLSELEDLIKHMQFK